MQQSFVWVIPNVILVVRIVGLVGLYRLTCLRSLTVLLACLRNLTVLLTCLRSLAVLLALHVILAWLILTILASWLTLSIGFWLLRLALCKLSWLARDVLTSLLCLPILLLSHPISITLIIWITSIWRIISTVAWVAPRLVVIIWIRKHITWRNVWRYHWVHWIYWIYGIHWRIGRVRWRSRSVRTTTHTWIGRIHGHTLPCELFIMNESAVVNFTTSLRTK